MMAITPLPDEIEDMARVIFDPVPAALAGKPPTPAQFLARANAAYAILQVGLPMLAQSPADLTASFRQVVGVGGTLEFLENLMESKNWLAALARTFEALECRVFVAAARMAVTEPDGAEPPAQFATPTGEDGELVAACGQFDALQRQVGELFDGPARIEDEAERDVALRPIEAAQDALLDRLCSLRAATLEGHHARAATVALYDPDILGKIDEGHIVERMVAALLRDLTAETRL